MTMNTMPLWQRSVSDLSRLLDTGKVSPPDLLNTFLERYEALNDKLNAFAVLDLNGARRSANAAYERQRSGQRLGPLDGIPVSVKDNLFVGGLPAQWGSLLFRDHIPQHDDICVERLRSAGAVIVGKSATAEFALSGRMETTAVGTTRNPWDPRLTAGGSSGGAVASVATGMTPIAIGTDAGGSIRMPASYTGLVGLRPSNGRIPRRYGFPPMVLDFQSIGLITRSVSDCSLLFQALQGPDMRDPVSVVTGPRQVPNRLLRIGWFDEVGGDRPDDEVRASLQHCLQGMATLGHLIEPCPPPYDIEQLRSIWDILSSVGAARVARHHPDWQASVTEPLGRIIERGMNRSVFDYAEAIDHLQSFRAQTSAQWGKFDVLVTPTAAAPAFPADQEYPETISGKPGSGAVQGMYCGWVNALGFSAISVPGQPHPDGRPIGIQFVARTGSDELLLQLGTSWERIAPWSERWPSMSA
ncbi:amidase [Brucella anthropi]|uniref:amidase n=1 Tax=Brucella anthropi TaxID=529 RepID=UPI00124F1E53|nr:amidase [Brucella anthropi]KAB2730820.1 amidase [Brucella anthropi]